MKLSQLNNYPLIAVFGGRKAELNTLEEAYNFGKLAAKNNWIILCGGKGGVMESVCKGVSESNGLSIGILTGNDKKSANPFVSIPLATGVGVSRNQIIARACDCAIAIGGHYGTLSEIAYALQMNKKIISLNSWNTKGMKKAKNHKEAIGIIKKWLSKK
jgi:uncharacterized protein (TIGR00725 family)